MRKVEAQEQACLDAAHLVITPSGVTRQYLVSKRGVSTAKIQVIANGVDAEMFRPTPVREPDGMLKLLYFGTLSPWQGVELGIRALAQIRLQVPAQFTIIGTGSGSERGSLLALASRLGVASFVHLLPPMPQAELMEHLGASDLVLAPLTLNDRNLVQGCCPLKILESMAAGIPVIASDLPVVRELGSDGEHFLLVKPGSVDQIAHAAVQISGDRSMAKNIAHQARAHVLANYTWDRSSDALVRVYEELLSSSGLSRRNR
jgi:glycosyltransferase involved in cell wall biosynthesis